MEREILELQRDTQKRLDFENVEMEEENDLSCEAGLPSSTLIDTSDASSINELRETAQGIRRRLKSLEEILNDEFEGVIEEEQSTLILAAELKNYLRSKREEYIEMFVAQGTLQWLANWKPEDVEVDYSPLSDESEIDSRREEVESERSAEAVLQIESLIKEAAGEVKEMKTSILNEYNSIEEMERELDKLDGDEGLAADLDNDDSGPSSFKPSGTLQELESSIQQKEDELQKYQKEYAEAEAAAESRIKQYEVEIEELQAEAVKLNLEEESLRMIDSFASEYLGLQRHMVCSNGISVNSLEDGCFELRLRTCVSESEFRADSAGNVSNSILEHTLRVAYDRETMDIEVVKLTPDNMPMQDFLAEVQEKRTQEMLFGPGKEISKLGSQVANLVNVINEWISVHSSKATTGT